MSAKPTTAMPPLGEWVEDGRGIIQDRILRAHIDVIHCENGSRILVCIDGTRSFQACLSKEAAAALARLLGPG